MELNSSTFKYETFTKKRFRSVLDDIIHNYTSLNNGFVVYVGKLGQISLDIEMMRCWYNFPETYIESVNKGKYAAIIHLDKKPGLYKAYYNAIKNNFDIKKGTQLLYTCKSVSPQTFEKLGFEISFKTSNKKYPIKELKEENLEWEIKIND